MKRVGSWKLESSEYASEPSMVATRGDDHVATVWLGWSQRSSSDAAESVFLTQVDLGETDALPRATEPPLCLSRGPDASWVTLAARGSTLAACWIEKDPTEGYRLMAWRPDTAATPIASGERVLRRPTALLTDKSTLVIAVESWNRDQRRYALDLVARAHGTGRVQTARLASAPELICRPALAEAADGSLFVVWERVGAGKVTLEGALVDGESLETIWTGVVVDNGAFNQAPAVCAQAGGGFWLAYATDCRLSGSADLARAVRLADVRRDGGPGGELRAVELPFPGVDLEARGEDQSLEFPALAAVADGCWVAARASHNYRLAKFVAGAGWSEPFDLGPVLWGCRGIRLSAVALDEGSVAVAAHDRKGIEVTVVEHASASAAAPVDSWSPVPCATSANAEPREETRPEWALGDPEEVSYRPYMGDIHFHSAFSDGLGTVEEAYVRCRDRYRHDFACLTDHDAFIGRRITRSTWELMMDVADAFNRPADGFATLIGLEYTGARYPGPGHKCVYLRDRGDLVCKADGLEDPADLLERVRGLGAIAIPHHVGWLGGDFEHHDPKVQPCWEICSAHGQYEAEIGEPDAPTLGHRLGLAEHREPLRDHFIRRRLEAGQIFGFVGGSDGHGLLWHHGITDSRDSHRTGLTGVWVQALGRQAVFDAIAARRTWATSGARMILRTSVNGVPMGDELESPPGTRASLELGCWADGTIDSVDIFVASESGTTKVAAATDAVGHERWQGAVEVPLANLGAQRGALYVRLRRSDGQLAWASPIFW